MCGDVDGSEESGLDRMSKRVEGSDREPSVCAADQAAVNKVGAAGRKRRTSESRDARLIDASTCCGGCIGFKPRMDSVFVCENSYS